MDRSFTLLLVSTTLVVAAAPGCAAMRVRSTDLADTTLKDAGLARYWTADVPIPSDDSLAEVYLVDDTLYLYTLEGIVFALQADTGLIRWGKKLSARNFSIQKPGHIAGAPGYSLAAFVTPGGTQILDRYSGSAIASFPNEFAVGGAPVGAGDTLFMGSADGNVYALVWHTAGSCETIQWWKVRAGGPVTATPILYGGDRLIVASQGGHVFSGLGSFAFWLRSGEIFAPSLEGYWDEMAQTMRFGHQTPVSLASFMIEPISVQNVPMQIPILGMLMAAFISIPILISILYRFWSSLPFIAVVGFLAAAEATFKAAQYPPGESRCQYGQGIDGYYRVLQRAVHLVGCREDAQPAAGQHVAEDRDVAE